MINMSVLNFEVQHAAPMHTRISRKTCSSLLKDYTSEAIHNSYQVKLPYRQACIYGRICIYKIIKTSMVETTRDQELSW